jgi:hypothetical protein
VGDSSTLWRHTRRHHGLRKRSAPTPYSASLRDYPNLWSLLIGLLAFAKELEDLFSTSTEFKVSLSLVDKLENHIQSFPLNLGSAAASKYSELDKSGTALWNLSARLRRDDKVSNAQTLTVLAMTRLYALLMLDCAHISCDGAFTNIGRIMKVALKTAKSCLGAKLVYYYPAALAHTLPGRMLM